MPAKIKCFTGAMQSITIFLNFTPKHSRKKLHTVSCNIPLKVTKPMFWHDFYEKKSNIDNSKYF